MKSEPRLEQTPIIFHAKPSLRRAYLFAFLYAFAVLYGRIATDLNPMFNPIWKLLFFALMGILAWVHLTRWCTDYIITPEEIQSQEGVIARETKAVPHERVTNAAVAQTVFERLLGIGTLQIDTAGGTEKEIEFRRITTQELGRANKIIREARSRQVAARPRPAEDAVQWDAAV